MNEAYLPVLLLVLGNEESSLHACCIQPPLPNHTRSRIIDPTHEPLHPPQLCAHKAFNSCTTTSFDPSLTDTRNALSATVVAHSLVRLDPPLLVSSCASQMSTVTVNSTAASPASSLHPSHSVDQVSYSTTPATGTRTFLYALLGFTLLSLTAGAAYEWWHRRSDGRDSSDATGTSGSTSGGQTNRRDQ